MSEKRWKTQERRIAHFLALERITHPGQRVADAGGEWLVVEVKDRARFPGWISLALDQVAHQAKSHQLPIVVLTGAQAPRDLVVMDLRDFRDWFGQARKAEKGG